jgi:hypothetical protein
VVVVARSYQMYCYNQRILLWRRFQLVGFIRCAGQLMVRQWWVVSWVASAMSNTYTNSIHPQECIADHNKDAEILLYTTRAREVNTTTTERWSDLPFLTVDRMTT